MKLGTRRRYVKVMRAEAIAACLLILAACTASPSEEPWDPVRRVSRIEAANRAGDYYTARDLATEYLNEYPNEPGRSLLARQYLQEAEEWIARIEAGPASADRVLDERIVQRRDDVDRLIWYMHKYGAHRYETRVELYLGRSLDGGAPWIRFRAVYHGSGWLFFHSLTVVADNQRFDWTGLDVERDNTDMAWETYDRMADGRILEMIRAVIASDQALIRFRGSRGYTDHKFTEVDRIMLRDLLTAYEVLGGTFPQPS
ncbi:MAG: hypothetical protein JSV91_02170 [Phycisphaerales bacterium]|nr:MAG: hypothetical protein JSV91_02170 [Phycisphaerales bacterium]